MKDSGPPTGFKSSGHHWFPLNIVVKELHVLPIFVSTSIWGQQWQGKHVLCFSNNMAVVHALNSHTVTNPQFIHLLRALFFVEACYSLLLKAKHIASVVNTAVANISRNNLLHFCISLLQADPLLCPIQDGLLPLLFNLKAGWPSWSWCQQLNSTLPSH